MDNFENSTVPQEQEFMVDEKCFECTEKKLCHEYIQCCTGTRFHYCESCLKKLRGE